MNKKEKQQIKYLLENLKWYVEAPNEQDYNGEYEPPMEWEQGEAKIFLKYLEEKNKEIERLNNIINELEKELNKDFNTYMTGNKENGKVYKAGANNYRMHIYLKLQELKGSDKE